MPEIFNSFFVGLARVTSREVVVPSGCVPKSIEVGEILTISAETIPENINKKANAFCGIFETSIGSWVQESGDPLRAELGRP
jgi:hypothetical protein